MFPKGFGNGLVFWGSGLKFPANLPEWKNQSNLVDPFAEN